MTFAADCRPCAVGSMPQVDPGEACDLVLRYLPDIPVWPQLPRRSSLESMYVQYQEGFPGTLVSDGKIVVDGQKFLEDGQLEALYAAVEAGESRLPSPQRAAGLATMVERLRSRPAKPLAVKGQVTGPISQGLQMTGLDLRPSLYDETVADALVKQAGLMARGQEQLLSALAPTTIISVDAPYLSVFGSALFSLSREQVVDYLDEVFSYIQGLKAVHCCANTDWSIVLSTAVDVLSFDAYGYAESLALYAEAVKAFLARGGIIAWGIVPAEERGIQSETVDGLVARLEAAMQMLVEKGIRKESILPNSLVTPSCGLGSVSPALSLRALELTAGVSEAMRRRYFGERGM
ncbi:MAG: methionine synthase [Chloroflexi bacterium]|nr:methionine synthase [Chloroflexota bacterium]